MKTDKTSEETTSRIKSVEKCCIATPAKMDGHFLEAKFAPRQKGRMVDLHFAALFVAFRW
jgi:hypothetical protein